VKGASSSGAAACASYYARFTGTESCLGFKREGVLGQSGTKTAVFAKQSQQVFCYHCLSREGTEYDTEFNKLLALSQ